MARAAAAALLAGLLLALAAGKEHATASSATHGAASRATKATAGNAANAAAGNATDAATSDRAQAVGEPAGDTEVASLSKPVTLGSGAAEENATAGSATDDAAGRATEATAGNAANATAGNATDAATSDMAQAVGVAAKDTEVAGLSERLHLGWGTAQELEASLAQMRQRLADAHGALSRATKNFTDQQPRLWHLSWTAASSQRRLAKLTRGAANLTIVLQGLEAEVNRTAAQVADDARAVEIVALTAKQLNSMGELRSRHGGCLDATDPGTNGGRVQVWTCLKGQTNQQWVVNPQSHLVSHMHGICLAAPTPGMEGTTVMMWACDAKLVSQQWTYEEASGLLRNAGGLCLAATDPASKGSGLELHQCDAAAQGQQWDVVVGNAGLRQRMDALNKELWTLQDPASHESMDGQEKRVDELEMLTDELEGVLASKARQVLVKRLRHQGNRLRRALGHLGGAAAGGGRADEGVAPLGMDLGLDG